MSEVQEVESAKAHCFHCGEQCEDEVIVQHQHQFCCSGCVTVYEILNENGLSDYYKFEDTPGESQRQKNTREQFEYLDLEEIQQAILKFRSEDQAIITLQVPAIHCSSCIWLLENLYKLHPGIIRSRVNFIKKTAQIYYKPNAIKLSELAHLLQKIGYTPKINLDQADKKKSKSNNSLFMKIGAAGFCFGNIMLLSFPEYFGMETFGGEKTSSLFAYINLALSLPVFFYSGLDYIKSAYTGLKQKFINIDVPIALGLITLLIRTAYEIISKTGAGYADSLAGLVFFLLIGKWFQSKTYENLNFERDFKSFFPLAITRIVDGVAAFVPVKEINKGDELVVRNGEIIPADSRLLTGEALIDYSFVTGESKPQRHRAEELIYAGGKQAGPSIRVLVEKPMSQSYLTSLWNNQAFHDNDSLTQRFLDKVAHYFTLVILSIALVSGVYWYVADAHKVWEVVSAILIVACPCALALSVPFTYGNGIRVFGLNKLYLRNAAVIETMSRLNTIVFDKTGTLTSPEHAKVVYTGQPLSSTVKQEIAAVVSSSTHPLSRRIFSYLNMQESSLVPQQFMEINGKGISCEVAGVAYKVGASNFSGAPALEEAFNDTCVYINRAGEYLGVFRISNSYRRGLDWLFRGLKNKLSVFLLSGDNEGEKDNLLEYFPQDQQMRFNQKPGDKLDFIHSLQNDEKCVMMVGDGLNDAGALKQSDIGLAVTDDVALFSPSCDGIMEGNQLAMLPEFIAFSKRLSVVVVISIALSLLYNVGGLTLAIAGKLTPVFAAILMPLSSITVVAFTTITVYFLAKKLNLKS